MTPTDAYQMLQLAQWFQWFLSSQVPLWAYSVQMEFTEAAEMFVYDFEAVRTLGDGRQDRNKEYEFEVWRRSWRSCRSWGTLMLKMRGEGPSVDFKVLTPPSWLSCFVLPKISQNGNVLLGKWYFLLYSCIAKYWFCSVCWHQNMMREEEISR